MSRTRNTEMAVNPSKRRISWSSDDGKFVWYDKENDENVPIEALSFLILDSRFMVSGFNEAKGKGMWSNELPERSKESLNVRIGKHTEFEGAYADIKDEVKAAGGKYTASLYVLVLDKEGTNYIANVRLYGAAYSGWLDFVDKVKAEFGAKGKYQIGVVWDSFVEKKKGKVKYTEPTFKWIAPDKIPDEISDEADTADGLVQAYFDEMVNNPTTMDSEDQEAVEEAKENSKLQGSEVYEEEAPVVDDDDLPF